MTSRHNAPPAPPRVVVAVDGIDGSGKSVLARRLADIARATGMATVTFAVDDFRRPVDWRAGGLPEAEIYYHDYYDLDGLERCLAAFLAGAGALQVPIFDASANRVDGSRQLDCSEATLGIVEGVFALRLPTVVAKAPLVYLQTTFPAAHGRIVARDTARGRTLADVSHRIASRYFPAQERYIEEFAPATRAQVLIDNEDLSTPRLVRFDERGIAEKVGGARASSPAPNPADGGTPAAGAGSAPACGPGPGPGPGPEARVLSLLSRACAGFASPGTLG